MKKILTAFVFCFLCGECFSQAGEWVWIKGDSVPYGIGNFGTIGVSSPTNNPPALYEPCEWTDLNGNFWLFGGCDDQDGPYSDLWKYNPLLNEWTWMKGPGVQYDPGSYGTQGISSPTNNPPARIFGMTSWTDNQNNLWILGGCTSFGDLWKYDISINEWTWMKGPNIPTLAVYGTQGVPDPANNPGGRCESAAAWTDNTGNLWFFGGDNGAGNGPYNDLWRYSIATNQWTWMKGSQFLNQSSTYGIKGIESTANTPGARMAYSHWKDYTGKLWLFSGWNYTQRFNDLWRYNPDSNNWAWISGDSVSNSTGSYGTKCIVSPNNVPSARFENRAVWVDQTGNFWCFGGGNDNSYTTVKNDLWMYCLSMNIWIWASGDSLENPSGNWGTIGVSSSTNMPNGRAGAIGWNDQNGHFYLFGGTDEWVCSPYNDLWKYTIDTTCGACPISTGIEENNSTNELLVFPNPTNSSLTISFQSSEKQNIELRLYNTLGEVLLFQSFKTLEKFFSKEKNVANLSDGIYFLQLKTKEGNINRKVIINH